MANSQLDPTSTYQVTMRWDQLFTQGQKTGLAAATDANGNLVDMSSYNFAEVFNWANNVDAQTANQALKDWFKANAGKPVNTLGNGPVIELDGKTLSNLYQAASPSATIIPGIPNPAEGNPVANLLDWAFGKSSTATPGGTNPNPGNIDNVAIVFGNFFGFLLSPEGLALMAGVVILFVGYKALTGASKADVAN